MFFVAVLILFSLIYVYYCYQRKSGLPGPWNLPIIGSLHLLDPKAPHLSISKLAQKYGPIFFIKLGIINAVVVSDAQLVKKILIKDESLGRPQLYVIDYFLRDKGLVWVSGDLWKDQRKFVNNFLRISGASKASTKKKLVEDFIHTHVEELVKNIKSEGPTLIPDELFQFCINNIASCLLFGKSWSRDDELWKKFSFHLEDLTMQSGLSGPLNVMPFLRFLPQYKGMTKLMKETYNGLHQVQNEINKDMENSFNDKMSSASNLIHAFLLQKLKSDSKEIYSKEQLEQLALDLYTASVESTVNWTLWAMYYLAAHQEVQNKTREELNSVLQNRAPAYDDLLNLPYLEATISEVGRIRPIAFLGFPHRALDEIVVEGFKIPKGTTIISSLWNIHMDAKVWEKPEQFRPERFLNYDGKYQQPESFIPFQAGKRVCPGEEFGRTVIFLLVSTILQNFKIRSVKSIDLNGICGITLRPKPQELVFENISTDSNSMDVS